MKIFVLKLLDCRKLGHSSEMQNDALMYREGLKGKYRGCSVVFLTHKNLNQPMNCDHQLSIN